MNIVTDADGDECAVFDYRIRTVSAVDDAAILGYKGRALKQQALQMEVKAVPAYFGQESQGGEEPSAG